MTDVGREYLVKVAELATTLDTVNQSVACEPTNLSGTLRVTAAGPFAESVVMPKLIEFLSLHQGLKLVADFNNRNVDLVEENYDFALRYGQMPSSALVARKLATHQLACVASNDYLAQHGEPLHPSDLKTHSCIASNNDTWMFCEPADQSEISVKVSGRLRTNSIPVMQRAVGQGFGVAYSPIENLRSLINAGRVKRILAGYEDQSRNHWIVYPDRRLMPTQVRAAINFLISSLHEHRK